MSFVDLPAHVAVTILRRLDARDLCALRATCRAFDAALVETAAFEATRARAPWLAAPRHREGAEGPERAPASAKHADETWLDLLRFAELAAAARLPRVFAAEDVTAVVDREGRVHVWGPVVDAQGHELDHPDSPPSPGGHAPARRDAKRAPNPARTRRASPSAPRCVAAAAGYACSFGAGGVRGGLRAFRNVAGVETIPGSDPRTRASRPPAGAGARGAGAPSGSGRPPEALARSRATVSRARLPDPSSTPATATATATAAPTPTVFSRLFSRAGDAGPAGPAVPATPATLAVGAGPGSGPPRRVVSIAVGRTHALAAAADGSLWSWGNDVAGQLGLGRARVSATLAQLAFGSTERFSSSPKSRDRARRMRRDRDGAGGSPRAASPAGDAARRRADEATFFPAAGDARAASPTRHADFVSPTAMRRVERFSDASADRPGRPRRDVVVVAVAASRHGSACVTADGALFCWGSNRRGALGLGDDLDRDVPTRVHVRARDPSAGGSDAGGSDDSTDDATGDDATDDDATGDDATGDASRLGARRPRSPGSARRVASASAWTFPGALSDTDSDSDSAGARASRGDARGEAPASPEVFPSPPRRRRRRGEKRRDAVVTAFSYGARHAAAVTSRGALFCWGDNRRWQCGRAGEGRGSDAVLWPTRVELPPGSSDEDVLDDAAAATRRAPRVADVAAGAAHTLALDDSGRVWSFGAGHGLPPGDPEDGRDATAYDPREGHARRPPERARGVPRAVAVAAGARHSAVVADRRDCREAVGASRAASAESEGSGPEAESAAPGARATRRLCVYTWGANDAGQLGGTDRAPARPTPTRVASFRTSYYA